MRIHHWNFGVGLGGFMVTAWMVATTYPNPIIIGGALFVSLACGMNIGYALTVASRLYYGE